MVFQAKLAAQVLIAAVRVEGGKIDTEWLDMDIVDTEPVESVGHHLAGSQYAVEVAIEAFDVAIDVCPDHSPKRLVIRRGRSE